MLFDVDVFLNDVHLELEDADHDVIHAVSLFDVDVLLNDVHLELEDANHDVIHVIHVVSSPLSFKVVMKTLRMVKIKLLIWRNVIV